MSHHPVLAIQLVALASSVAGCRSSPTDVPSTPIATAEASYSVELDTIFVEGQPVWYVSVDIPIHYRNPTGEPILISYCQSPNPPRLEHLTGVDWEIAYEPPHLLCGSTMAVAPGQAFDFVFRSRAYDPASRVSPEWRLPGIDGTYRIVWTGVWSEAAPAYEPLPLQQRVSNAFQLTGALP